MSASRSVAGGLKMALKRGCGAWNTAAPIRDSTRVHCWEIWKATKKQPGTARFKDRSSAQAEERKKCGAKQSMEGLWVKVKFIVGETKDC